MPGLTEAHCHISFNDLTSMYQAVEIQPEDHALLALANAQMLLERGFTSRFSAASAKPRVDVAGRDGVNTIKAKVSGDRDWGHMHADGAVTVIAERELAAMMEVANARRLMVATHLHQFAGSQDERASGCASHLSCTACRRGSPRHAGGREGSHLRGARRRAA